MKQRVKELRESGDKLFDKRSGLLNLWQEMAENFHPMRADFTVKRNESDEFASHLMSGRPVLAHRDLANAFSAMLRPRGQDWFKVRTDNDDINKDIEALRWLDMATKRQSTLMYEAKAQFLRATKQADHDFVAFGQAVIEVGRRADRSGMLYRSWHLRDVAWCDNAELVIDVVHRNWDLEARALVKLFPTTAAPNVKECVDKDPYKEIKCRHIVLPANEYDYDYVKNGRRKRDLPFISIYIDVENDTILEEVPVASNDYVIPRWIMVAGNQYAYSPAAVVALPDARMLQQIGLTLLEAGQKAVDPPMKAVGEMIQGGVNLYAGGVTWVDSEYDETTGKALEPIPIDTRGLNWGVAREQACASMIAEAFYLNKITMPGIGRDMTATEVQHRFSEYIREAMPLFEPIETEYNDPICDRTFEHLMRMGVFGSKFDMPEILRGQNVRFQFESPLQAAKSRAKASAFMEAGNLLATAMQLDPSVRHHANIDIAFREAMQGTGVPADWLAPEDEAGKRIQAEREQQAKAAQAQQALSTVSAVAGVAGQAGEAAQMLQGAGVG